MLAPSILVGLTLHELAHGLVAFLLGDPTAKENGRLTLNPIKHLDPLGTILLFIAHFGWAKPVPVNPRNFSFPKRDMSLVALAGPLMNLVLAAIYGFGIRMVEQMVPGSESSGRILLDFLYLGLMINVSLALFNLLPIPPLDGSRLLHAAIPLRYERTYGRLERYGAFVLLAVVLVSNLMHVSIIGRMLRPAVSFFLRLFTGG